MSKRDYFTTPGPMSDPGRFASLLVDMPSTIGALRDIVQGLIIHVYWADQYGVSLDDDRRAELQLRAVTRQIARLLELDSRSFTIARPPERRLVGNCRDFTVLLTTLLRRQGVPARARCGFARYFYADLFVDHWVAEYWNAAEGRWILVDAQLDALMINRLKIGFDPLDVPRDEFITGGGAWQLCRAGQADPDAFGIHDMHGLWFIRGDLGRDVAALNKIELLPWDSWGIIDRDDSDLTTEDMAALDELAALTAHDIPEIERVRQLYDLDNRWRVPDVIRSYTSAGPQEVNWLSGVADNEPCG